MNNLNQTVQNVLMLTTTYLLSAKHCRLKSISKSFDWSLLKESQLGPGLLLDKTKRDRN